MNKKTRSFTIYNIVLQQNSVIKEAVMRALKVFICIIFIFEINMLWAQDIVKKPSLNLNEVENVFKGKRTVDDLFRILPVYEEWVKRFPDSYEANWKASRIYCEIGNSVSVNRKSKWHKKYGKLAMKHAMMIPIITS